MEEDHDEEWEEEDAEDQGEEEDDVALDWEEQQEELSRELAHLWGQSTKGQFLNTKEVLAKWPVFAGLPSKAPKNNNRPSRMDKEVRAWQTQLLHCLRGQAAAYKNMQQGQAALAQENFEKTFKLSADLYTKMLRWRKETQIPGSTTVHGESLFSKQDLNAAQLQQRLRRFRRCPLRRTLKSHFLKSSFRSFRSSFRCLCVPHAKRSLKHTPSTSCSNGFKGKGGKSTKGWSAWPSKGFTGFIGKGTGKRMGKGPRRPRKRFVTHGKNKFFQIPCSV